jgi:trehalose/maltose transport system permease protein
MILKKGGIMFGKKRSLAAKEQLLAYKLLLPAFIILLFLTVYPLGQVFYSSLTNAEFASDAPTKFVGFKNYIKLLSFSIKKVSITQEEMVGISKAVQGEVKSQQEFDEMLGKTWTPEQKAVAEARAQKSRFEFTAKEKAENAWQAVNDKKKAETGKSYVRMKTLDLIPFGSTSYIVIGSGDPNFVNAFINTIVFTVFSVFFELLFGLIVALVVNAKFIGSGLMRGVMLVPWAIITVVSAKIWAWMFQPNRIGVFNTIMSYFGWGDGRTSFLTDNSIALPSLIAIDVWKTTPFMALLLLAGLQLIPKDLYEAAEVDGANKVKQFYLITLPLLKPTITIALIFRTLASLGVFDLFQVLLGDRFYSLASYNYSLLIKFREMGEASAVGVLIFLIVFGFAWLYMKGMGVKLSAE